MMFRLAALAMLLAPAAAFEGGIRLNSKAGKKLMDKATVLEQPADRRLNQERDASFLATYAIQYQGCSDLIQVNGGEGGGNNEEGLLYTQHLVKFALCPNDSCSSCSGGGLYVVDMMQFVEAYTEAKLNEQEYTCEMIRENCYCNNYNDDERCENSCYTNAGHSECIQYEGQEDFEVQRYLECQEMENGNGNNNNNNNNQNYQYDGNNGNNYYGAYYIGPYCASDGESINLGVFYDQQCMHQADTTVFEKYNYMSLPYASEPLVAIGDCVSCKDQDKDQNNGQNNYNQNQQNGGNWYYQDMEANELCQRAYEDAARCEESMSINYPDTSGCEFIKNILPRMESATKKVSGGKSVSSVDGASTAKVFAWIFGVSTVLFGAYAYFLYRKIKRGAVNLSSQDGAMA